MATRENQGLQIALIIFLMITVGLAISTYYFFRQAEEQTKTAEAAEAKAKAADTLAKSRHYQLQSLKYMIGVPNITPEGLAALKVGLTPDEGMKEIDAIKRDYDNDMAMFDDTIPVENRNWRTLPQFMLSSLMKRTNDAVTAALAEQKQFKDKEALTAQEQARVAAAMDGLATAKADVAKQLADFTDQVQKSAKGKDELEDQLKKSGQELATVTEDLREKLTNSETKVRDLNVEVATKGDKIKDLTNESFERPHGKVTFVNLRNNTVYINLGRADGLQRQVTFSVYDQGINTLEVPDAALLEKEEDKPKSKRKASIEVIDVLDDHLAEARILDDKVTDPILPGDNIFTPGWRPGQKLEFALAGKLDLDGDRVSDSEKVKNMILTNGGVITYELPENGKDATGRITVNTRFLVIGDRPTEQSDDKALAAFANALNTADRNGVQQVSLKDLVAEMGWKGTDRTVKLGTTGAADVGKKDESKFRARPKPAAAAERSAF